MDDRWYLATPEINVWLSISCIFMEFASLKTVSSSDTMLMTQALSSSDMNLSLLSKVVRMRSDALSFDRWICDVLLSLLTVLLHLSCACGVGYVWSFTWT